MKDVLLQQEEQMKSDVHIFILSDFLEKMLRYSNEYSGSTHVSQL